MTAYLLLGDVLSNLSAVENEVVDCIVTSPPYWGLRSYLPVDHPAKHLEIGQEPTPAAYVARMLEVCRELKRVLKPSGTFFLNIGDSYYNYRPGNKGGMPGQTIHGGRLLDKPGKSEGCLRRSQKQEGLKDKDLVGIPWMLAFALRDDGWWLRQNIIWNKPACTPEKKLDRCTRSHEDVFLLTKAHNYYFDADAIQEPTADGTTTKLRRDVWSINPKPLHDAHFAVMPEELAELCILGGCPPGGTVLDPFMGSATVGVVAHRHGRHFIGSDINEAYVDGVALRRLQAAGVPIEFPLALEDSAAG